MNIKELLQKENLLISEINNKKFDKDTVLKLVRLNRELAEVKRLLSFYSIEETEFNKNEMPYLKQTIKKNEEVKKLEIEDDTLFYVLIGLAFNNKPFKILQFLNLVKSLSENKKTLQNKIV